ncbi:MAG: glutaredoxin [Moraxellaceae bacterium]|nr:glutaredoxin [Pseudobdellovibrionaceae bacterium]
MRKILSTEKQHMAAQSAIAGFHLDTVNEVESAISNNQWVIVGMKHNPVVTKARGILKDHKINYHYIEYGSYFSGWKKRLAIKLWSGWPTFPQVFHNGILVGGAQDLENYLKV